MSHLLLIRLSIAIGCKA